MRANWTFSLFFLFFQFLIPPSYAEVKSSSKVYGVSQRAVTDRYGANATTWAMAMLLSNHEKVPLYHLCQGSCAYWKDTIFHQILTDYCEKGPLPPNLEYLNSHSYWGVLAVRCRNTIDCDIPSAIYNSGLASTWFAYFDKEAKEKGWKLRWDPKNALLVHVRLDDIAPADGINGGDAGGWQQFIGNNELRELLCKLTLAFPEKEIYIMTSPNEKDVERCRKVAQGLSSVKEVCADSNLDYVLWQMMCTDVLVLSRSTFSMVAGLLHQGSHCFIYEKWPHLSEIMGNQSARWKDFSTY